MEQSPTGRLERSKPNLQNIGPVGGGVVASDIDELTRRLLEAESYVISNTSSSIADDTKRVCAEVNIMRRLYGLDPLPNPLEV